MERIISTEERIRKAEEIYQRRRTRRDVKVPTSQVNTNNKKEFIMYKKLILQIVICLLIYFIFYLIKNSNYIFSEEVLNRTKHFLSYDINFSQIYINIEEYYNQNFKSIIKNEENNDEEQIDQNEESQNENQEEAGIGGGEDEIQLFDNEIEQTSADELKEEKPLTQMEIDANDIKENYNLILPLKGTITSRFGPRTPTDIVSANHAGIDIGVNAGTIFVAAMEGIVREVSSQGGYGNHVYIEKDDIITLYAHCQKIYVKSGDEVKQGQQLGEVGSTGNATGPHLHFEIRKSNRVVNPEYILSF